MKCNGCGKFAAKSDCVFCTRCASAFHGNCVNFPEGTSVTTDWLCPLCKAKQPRSDNTATPVKGLSEYIQTSAVVSHTSSPHNLVEEANIHEWTLELRRFRSEMHEWILDLKLQTQKDMAEIKTLMGDCQTQIKDLEARIVILEERPSIEHEKVSCLQNTIEQLQLQVNDRDREVLLSDVELSGIPETAGESVMHIVMMAAAKLGVSIEERDIIQAERVGPKRLIEKERMPPSNDVPSSRPRPIAVTMTRRSLRDQLLKSARVRRRITTADMGLPPHEPCLFYVNERLTKHSRILFGKAREAGRRLKFKYIWTRDGRVFVRKNDTKPAHLLRTENDLIRVFGDDYMPNNKS